MRDLLEYLIKQIVNNPDAVKVEAVENDQGWVTLNVTVDPGDAGLVIGKGGNIIRALRNLVRIKAIKEGKGVSIELVEKEN